jgi:F0F1-type ATP synthase assembly protein I
VPLPYCIVAVQSCTGAVLVVLWLLSSVAQGASSALAAFAVIVPNALFAWQVVRCGDTVGLEGARRLVGSSVAKLVLGIALLVGIFVWYRPEPGAFFTTLIVVHAAQLVSPWLGAPRRRRARNESRTEER